MHERLNTFLLHERLNNFCCTKGSAAHPSNVRRIRAAAAHKRSNGDREFLLAQLHTRKAEAEAEKAKAELADGKSHFC